MLLVYQHPFARQALRSIVVDDRQVDGGTGVRMDRQTDTKEGRSSHLEQDVEDVGVSLLHLVEQHYCIRPPPAVSQPRDTTLFEHLFSSERLPKGPTEKHTTSGDAFAWWAPAAPARWCRDESLQLSEEEAIAAIFQA
jgi:hypothetical protein